jgi:orotidine-5'-phosphate decarboxylase
MDAREPTELIVALDTPTAVAAEKLLDQLEGLPVIYKVGLELFVSEGPKWVTQRLTSRGFRVFLDLKLHDIPNTVAKAVESAGRLGVELLTVHLAGGRKMLEAALAVPRRPKLLGVTVLTSFDEAGWGEVATAVSAIPASTTTSVRGFFSLAESVGMDGVVCSTRELPLLERPLFAVVPGIRPAGSSAQDQGRVATPREAAQAGARAIVVGRPITQAPDPRAAAHAVLAELSSCNDAELA